MPDDRFFHKRLGHSAKVNSLTDFEFRVWTQYVLSADDCGVLRYNAVTIQADNDALAAKPAKAVLRALDRIVDAGLLIPFEHQGQRYVCQRDWQDFQKVRFPRPTIHPCPPTEVLQQCTSATVALFRIRHGADSVRTRSDDGATTEVSPTPARAGGREWLTANGGGSGNGDGGDDLASRAGDFIERYKALHVRLRKGAHYIGRPALDFQEALQLVGVYDDARLDKLAFVWLNTDHDFAQNGTRSLAKFRSMASWCEERLIEWEDKHGPLKVA
jgi:hypothetical protein